MTMRRYQEETRPPKAAAMPQALTQQGQNGKEVPAIPAKLLEASKPAPEPIANGTPGEKPPCKPADETGSKKQGEGKSPTGWETYDYYSYTGF